MKRGEEEAAKETPVKGRCLLCSDGKLRVAMQIYCPVCLVVPTAEGRKNNIETQEREREWK